MIFTETTINGIKFSPVTTAKDKHALREFFKKHYAEVSEDVFPSEDLEACYNSLIIKATDSSGRIVAGLLSCAPPLLAEKVLTEGTVGAMNRVKRLTFLDLIAVDFALEEAIYPDLLKLYKEASHQNGIKSIIGFTRELSYLSFKLEEADFKVLAPLEQAPMLQGIHWELPRNEPQDSTEWFYKLL